MVLAVGPITQNSVGSNSASLTSAAASGGTGPYTYQWYRSATSGFTPGGGNIIAGATALNLSDSGLIPNTTYYYKIVTTDTGNSNAIATSAQLAAVTTPQQLSQNQFAQSPIVGQVDQLYNYNTTPVQIDSTQGATPLYAGMAVKIVDSAGGVPKVIGVTSDADEVFGYLNYNMKNVAYLAGDAAEISQDGNVIFLYATTAIARGAQCANEWDATGPKGVKAITGSTGASIVGYAFDKATAPGDLIRVKLKTPSYLLDS